MKLGKILLVFILVFVIGFFAIGVVVPKYEYQNSILVTASPQKCWDTLVCLSKAQIGNCNRHQSGPWVGGFE